MAHRFSDTGLAVRPASRLALEAQLTLSITSHYHHSYQGALPIGATKVSGLKNTALRQLRWRFQVVAAAQVPFFKNRKR